MSILSKNKKIIFLLFLLALSFYKSPYIFMYGRFMAEEGSFWFRNTYLFGYFFGLTQLFVGSGYFNFWPNLASIFANLVPIEFAPLVTVYFAFSVQFLLLLYILFQKSYFLERDIHKYFAAAIVLTAPTMVAEIWLNTLTSQVYFTIISSLILFQTNEKNFYTTFSPIVLFFSSLSSILTCILTPFFIKKYLDKKDKVNLYNLIIISVCSFFQLIIYLFIRINNLELSGANERYILSFYKFLNYSYNVVFKSFLGTPFTKYLYFNAIENIFLLIFLFIIFFLLLFLLIKSLKIIIKDKVTILLFSLFIIQSLLAIYAGKDNHVQGRFSSIPSIMLLFTILRISFLNFNYKYLFRFFIILSIVFGAYEFKNNNRYPQFLACLGCPDWKEEVMKWRNNNQYELRIWDYSMNKKMNLIN